MTGFTRRDTLKIGAGALAGTTLLGYRPAFGEVMAADVPAPKFQVEKGAELRVLRPAKFVQGDEIQRSFDPGRKVSLSFSYTPF